MLRIACAFGANIDLHNYFLINFHSCFTHEYRLPIGKYRAALRHIACAFGANIDLLIVPSSTADATAVRPLLGGAAPFSSRFQRATFPAIGKVYSTKIAPMVAIGRRLVVARLCTNLFTQKKLNKIICGYGEIGRRFRLRFLWVKHIVRVRVPLSAP